MSLSNAAQASWYQGFCSNAEGTIKTANGHSANFIQLTKRAWIGGKMTETVIRDEERGIRVSEAKKTEILNKSEESCDSNGGSGIFENRTVYFSQAKLVNQDGSLFDKNIVGVSQDLKSVDAILLCETNINGLTMCPKK